VVDIGEVIDAASHPQVMPAGFNRVPQTERVGQLEAFIPLKRFTVSAKHHLVDPALAAGMVGVGAQGLLLGEGTHPRLVRNSARGGLRITRRSVSAHGGADNNQEKLGPNPAKTPPYWLCSWYNRCYICRG